MKVLIISDTHRKILGLKDLLEKEGPFDMLIHLGDVEGDQQKIREMCGCPTEMVSGNCDDFYPNMTDLPSEKVIEIGKHRVFITHGHLYGVNFSLANIIKYAKTLDADTVMFGHTHKPVIEKDRDITLINPGSLAFPRQENRKNSYIIMNVDDEGDVTYKLMYL